MTLVLTVNGGSSSLKLALHDANHGLQRIAGAEFDRVASPGDAVAAFRGWLDQEPRRGDIVAVGHRVVHGMGRDGPELITPSALDVMRADAACDPNHRPGEIALIEACDNALGSCPQVACFDTVFHRTMPRVATLLPIPRRYSLQGVVRYGFHGLSYAYLMGELARIGDPAATSGRVILAHLGAGASLAAVQRGKSIDTTMGFSPAGGVPMATRSGDLDPGVIGFLARAAQLTVTEFEAMTCDASGMLGLSETSGDMRELLARGASDVRAAEAVAVFCYQVRKAVGALAAALGGVDTLVFAGGIGEHAPVVRARICDGLAFLGIGCDPARNDADASLISVDGAPVAVRVIPTDEGVMIARSVVQLLGAALGGAVHV